MASTFQIFDQDPQYQNDSASICSYVRLKLGLDIAGNTGVNVELSDNLIINNFEDSATQFSSLINSYMAKSHLPSLMGMVTGSNLSGSENRLPYKNLEFMKRNANIYGTEGNFGGIQVIRSGSIAVKTDQQDYDLNTAIAGLTTSSGERIDIVAIWHYAPYTAYRFYSQSSYINYTLNEFGIKYFTPETAYYLLPTWEDTMRQSQYKYSHKLRRSNYTWELKGNKLRIFPVPTSDVNVWLEYRVMNNDPFSSSIPNDPTLDGVSNISNMPYGYIQYSHLNSLSKFWIKRMTLAMSKEVLGNIRNKFSSIPIANGDVTLNGGELISQAQKEQDDLVNNLKELLESTTYVEMAKREAEQADAEMQLFKKIPLFVFKG